MRLSFLQRHSRQILAAAIPLALILLIIVPSPGASVGAWFYELLQRSPEPRPELHAGKEFLVIGHRGSAGYEVENTIPSMIRAMDVDSANALEIDLCMTADGVIVLWHDWDPDEALSKIRERGGEPDVLCRPHFPDDDLDVRRPIHELEHAAFLQHYGYESAEDGRLVEAQIPTLEEFMGWASGKERLRCLFLDIKIPEDDSALVRPMMERVGRIVASRRPAYRIVYLTPFESIYRELNRVMPDAVVSFDAEPPPGVVLDPCEQSSVRHAIASGESAASIIHPYTSTVAPWTTSRRIVECDLETRMRHNASGPRVPVDLVVSSTMNDQSKLEWLIALGIDGVITDFPDRLRALARRMGKKVE